MKKTGLDFSHAYLELPKDEDGTLDHLEDSASFFAGQHEGGLDFDSWEVNEFAIEVLDIIGRIRKLTR